MFENVDEFLLCRPYVGILELVVGRLVKLIRPILWDSITRIITTTLLFLPIFQHQPQFSPPLTFQYW